MRCCNLTPRRSLLALALLLCMPARGTAADFAKLVEPYPRPPVTGAPWTPQQIAALNRDIAAILARKALRGAHVGFIAAQSSTGQILDAKNSDDDFMPASNFKLLTGSAALHTFGRDFVLNTSVLRSGNTLYLRGGGDPLITAADLEAAAVAVANSGASDIDQIVTDKSFFDDQRYGMGWSWDDLPYYYAPDISALSLEENIVHIYMSPGDGAGAPVRLRIEPQSSAFVIDNRMTTAPASGSDTSDIVRSFDDWKTITLTGTYPLGAKESGDIQPAVPDAAAYAGDVFARALSRHGLTVKRGIVPGVTAPDAAVIWTHQSEPFAQLLADFWWPSDNLLGELLLKRMGVAQSGVPGTDAHGIEAENAYLRTIGVDPATVSITDGSGLSQYDRITPHDLLLILQADWKSADRDVVLDALPLAGVRGSLKSSFAHSPAEKRVFAKTGYISHSYTISGFLSPLHHGAVTFSLMINDTNATGAQIAQIRQAIFSRIITD